MPIPKGDSAAGKAIAAFGAGRPKGSTKPKWNNIQDLFDLTIEEWHKLSPCVKVEKGIRLMEIILAKVPNIHLTAEESVKNVLGEEIEKAKQEATNGLNTIS